MPRGTLRTRGSVIGRYVILDHIASGGMGDVYSAYDPQLDRKVALKLLRNDDPARDARARARHQREAQALAKVSHPNVVSVFDVGALGEEVFLVTEYVDAGTLTAWLREGRRSWREIVDVFMRAGRGLAAAHDAGIVHRDFKPDNVLIGTDGRVRVTDFGLARAATTTTEDSADAHAVPAIDDSLASGGVLDTPLTAHGAILGTPSYMSPEQHRGLAVDARSDQFSFCISLYEALYREHPFGRGTRAEVARAIKRGAVRAPPPESDVPKWLRRQLVRGLAAEPGARHADMHALLAVLSPDRRQVWRWAVGVAALAAAGAAALLVVRGSATRADVCRFDQKELAGVWDGDLRDRSRQAFLATRKPFADNAWRGATDALDAWATAYAGMEREACEATRVRGVQSAELLDRRMACLAVRRSEVSALVDLFLHADVKTVERAVQLAQGLRPVSLCGDLPALTAPVPRPRPEQADMVESLRRRVAQVAVLSGAGKFADARKLADTAVSEARALGYQPLVAEAVFELGNLQNSLADYKSSQALFEEAEWTAVAVGDDRLAAAAAINLHSLFGNQTNRFEEAHRAGRGAEALIARIGGSLELEGRLHNTRGQLAFAEGNYLAAEDEYRRALVLYRRAMGRPTVGEAAMHNNLGNALAAHGKIDEALAEQRESLAIRLALVGPAHPLVATAHSNAGFVLIQAHRFKEAQAELEQALTLREAVYDPGHPFLATTHGSLGFALTGLGRLDEAIAHLEKAVAIDEKALGPDHTDVAEILSGLARARIARGDLAEAERRLERAMAIYAKAVGLDHPSVAEARAVRGALYHAQGRFAESLREYQQAVALVEKAHGETSLDMLEALTGVGRAYVDLGDAEKAVPPLRRALAVPVVSGDPGDLADAQFALARALEAGKGEVSEWRSLAEKARDGYGRAGATGEKRLAAVTAWLAGK